MQLLFTWIFVLFVALSSGNSRALQDEILEEREQKEEEEEGGQSHLTRPPPPKETIKQGGGGRDGRRREKVLLDFLLEKTKDAVSLTHTRTPASRRKKNQFAYLCLWRLIRTGESERSGKSPFIPPPHPAPPRVSSLYISVQSHLPSFAAPAHYYV